jgi:hypothetical protein
MLKAFDQRIARHVALDEQRKRVIAVHCSQQVSGLAQRPVAREQQKSAPTAARSNGSAASMSARLKLRSDGSGIFGGRYDRDWVA